MTRFNVTARMLLALTSSFALAASDPHSGLLLAVRSNNMEAVRQALAQGADVNAADASGMTALMYATYYGFASMAIIQTLLAQGAQVNHQDKEGTTALILAARGQGGPDSDKIVRALLEKGANPNLQTSQGSAALAAAINPWHGEPRLEIVSALLAKGAEANARLNGEATVLMVASKQGEAAIVSALLDHGADAGMGEWSCEHGGPCRCTGPFDWASSHPNIVKLLVSKGAKPTPHCDR